MSDQDEFRWDNAYGTAADFQVPAEVDSQPVHEDQGFDSWSTNDSSLD